MKKKSKRLTERQLEHHLIRHFQRKAETGDLVRGADSFRDRGVLTGNRGLVVELANGQEFQITLVESTRY